MQDFEQNAGPPALVLRALRKTFTKAAVDGLDLTVRAGEFYALLGPNGAGKTTTLRMVAGLLPADSRRNPVFGVDARRTTRSRPSGSIAWLPDEPMLYDKLDPLEYLEFVAGLWGVEPAGARRSAPTNCCETLGLWDHRHERCEGFSRGMKQKVALAGALDPRTAAADARRAADRPRRRRRAPGEGSARRARARRARRSS